MYMSFEHGIFTLTLIVKSLDNTLRHIQTLVASGCDNRIFIRPKGPQHSRIVQTCLLLDIANFYWRFPLKQSLTIAKLRKLTRNYKSYIFACNFIYSYIHAFFSDKKQLVAIIFAKMNFLHQKIILGLNLILVTFTF